MNFTAIKEVLIRRKKLLFFVVSAFFLVTYCSMTSFLFPIHSRVDQNCFFTVGRGILQGQVPYRDLYEHKGPLTYFMHAFAALISDTTFIGVFILQVLLLIIFLIYTDKIAGLFISKKYTSLISVITAFITMTTNAYLRGNNAEEYAYCLMAVTMYYMLKRYISPISMPKPKPEFESNKVIFINGIIIGCLLWIKFNLLGFWIGWGLFTFVPVLIKRDFKRLFRNILSFLGGFGLTTVPWVIYFGIKGAIKDWMYTYFYCNIFLYTKEMTFSERLESLEIASEKNYAQNTIFIIILAFGLFSFLLSDKFIKNVTCRMSLIVSFIFMYLGVYWGGVWYDYYMLIIAGYAIFGVIAIYDLIRNSLSLHKHKLVSKRYIQFATIALSLIAIMTYNFSNCYPFYKMKKSDYPQFKFAAIINNKPDATLLNYGFIDGGFYLAAGIQPQMKFFHKVNITKEDFPEMYEQQLKIVKECSVDFVVARTYADQNEKKIKSPELFANYKIISTAIEKNDNYKYYLFREKNDLEKQIYKAALKARYVKSDVLPRMHNIMP